MGEPDLYSFPAVAVNVRLPVMRMPKFVTYNRIGIGAYSYDPYEIVKRHIFSKENAATFPFDSKEEPYQTITNIIGGRHMWHTQLDRIMLAHVPVDVHLHYVCAYARYLKYDILYVHSGTFNAGPLLALRMLPYCYCLQGNSSYIVISTDDKEQRRASEPF